MICSLAIGFAVASVVLLGSRLARRRFGRGSCGHGRHRARFGGGPGGSFWLRSLFGRLDTTPGQEREIRAALETLQERGRAAKSDLGASREDLARAIVAEELDDAALAAATSRVDDVTAKAKEAFTDALRRIHAVLDPRQRERLAEIVARGFGPFGRFGGPYRSGV